MVRTNCRTDNRCVFCKYWNGTPPKVNYRNGMASYEIEEAICSLYKEKNCKSNGICNRFEKKLMYL